MNDLLVLAGILALGQFTPGPDMLLVTRTALDGGVRAGIATAAGIATGLMVHAALAVAGMAVVFERIGWLRESMRWLAAVYLVWLGCRMVAEWFAVTRGRGTADGAAPDASKGAFFRGLLCNLLNPKAVLFLAAVITPFLTGARPYWWPWALWALVVFEGLVLWMLWAVVLQARPVRVAYRKSAPWVTLAFGIGLVALAVALVGG